MENLTSKLEQVCPDNALEMLQHNTRNRPMKKNLVIFYADQMLRGLWKVNGEPIIIGDGNVLLNGQHRLAAVVKSKTTQHFIIIRGVDPNTQDTMDTGVVRTAGDMLSMNDVKNANRIAAYISAYFNIRKNIIVTSNSKVSKHSKQEIVMEYNQNKLYWQDVNDKASHLTAKLKLMSNKALGGYIAYLTKDKKHSIDVVYSFFKQLYYAQNVENEVINLLRDKLLKEATGQYKMTAKLRHVIITKTWNAYLSGRELKILRHNLDETIPDFI